MIFQAIVGAKADREHWAGPPRETQEAATRDLVEKGYDTSRMKLHLDVPGAMYDNEANICIARIK